MELFIGIVGIYLIVIIFLFFFQRNLMYHPDENNYSGDNLEVNIEKVAINSKLVRPPTVSSPHHQPDPV